jgi:hypothetical protein
MTYEKKKVSCSVVLIVLFEGLERRNYKYGASQKTKKHCRGSIFIDAGLWIRIQAFW